jgi:hypothetical protein
MRLAAGAWLLLAAFPVSVPAAAQHVGVADDLRVRLSGRLHVQFSTTSVDSAAGAAVPASEFIIRRARLTFDVTVNDLVSARLEPDYSTTGGVGRFSLKDAFIRLTFGPAVRATLGHFKRPFDLFQLASTTQLVVAERGGQVRGVRACGALPTVCSYSNLAVGLIYADRDLGVMLDGDVVPRRLRYAVALTNGEAAFSQETTDGKQLTGRVSASAAAGVTVSANATYRDYTHPATAAMAHALGWGGDLEIGDYAGGLHVLAAVIGGDNWRVARAAPQDTADVVPFLAGQVIATYRQPLDARWASGIEPTARVSWADPNRTVARDEGWLLTPGVIVHLRTRSMLFVNLDVWLPREGDTEYALVSQVSVNF